jgi:aspartyl-tRNA(Asn)/glutamyl-tRNA(Gln) amidotransferase subunit A
LISPTTPTVAFEIGERADDPVAMYKADLATLPSSLYGGPAMSLPAGLGDHDLPVGVQLMAPVQADERVYRVGAELESALIQRWGGPLLDRRPALATGGAA